VASLGWLEADALSLQPPPKLAVLHKHSFRFDAAIMQQLCCVRNITVALHADHSKIPPGQETEGRNALFPSRRRALREFFVQTWVVVKEGFRASSGAGLGG
jgi:hypothetical protein